MDAEPRAPDSETSRRAALLPSTEHGAVGSCIQKPQVVEGGFVSAVLWDAGLMSDSVLS